MSTWSEAEDELLTSLWREGLSYSQIVNELAREGYPVRSRSAAIGRADRLGLKRPKAVAKGPRLLKPLDPKPAVASPPKPLPVVDQPPPPITAGGISIMDLLGEDATCRWPLWLHSGRVPVEQQLYCGDKPAAGRPYCAHHCKLAYQPREARRAA